MLPSLVFGTLISHSSPQNLTWAAQFSEQFRAGIPYPRWMPDSFDGLGSPAFYFYPPLPFWLDSLVSIATFNLLTVPYRLAVTSTVLLLASGLAMHAWLRHATGNRLVALAGGVAYMAAPYHLLDHYTRGAFAEFTAFVFLPLVVLSIDLVARRRRGGMALLAATFAALLMSHLPAALLASLTVVPLYVLRKGWRRPDIVARCAAGGVLGLALAAVYLGPALLMQDTISAQVFWSGFYQVENWFVVAPSHWPESYLMWMITLMVVCDSLVCVWLCVAFRHHGDVTLWAGGCLVCLVLLSGLVPWFWQLPELDKVQFPWRLMAVVEFMLLTALCVAPFGKVDRSAIYALGGAAAAGTAAMALLVYDVANRIAYGQGHSSLARQDVREYMPHAFPHRAGLRYDELGLEAVAATPPISCAPVARLCRAEPGRFGALAIELDSDQPTTVTLRRFAFPAWQLAPPLPITATEPYRLVSFVAPAGQHLLRLDRQALWPERWGWIISCLSAVLLLAGAYGAGFPPVSRRNSS
jgi:hypothetical protein